MPSTYTANNGIELIGSGEQTNTWDVTTNLNFDILDQSLDGQATVTLAGTGSSGTPNTISITDGALSDGRNRFIAFNDGGDLGGDAFVQLNPNTAQKIIFVQNNLTASRSIFIFQGTYSASNDYELGNGSTAILRFDGNGAGAVVSEIVLTSSISSAVTITSGTIAGVTIDNSAIGGSTPAAGAFTTISSSGLATLASVDINGGAVDSATIGAATPSTGAFTTLSTSGLATLASVDINAGAVDNATVGAATPSTGAFTTLSASGATSVAALTASGVLSVASDIQHTGDTDNKIAFTTDTQTYQTGASTRLDMNNSGVRLGAANARVTTILDEDNMASNSATALATQQSIKAYVDTAGSAWEYAWHPYDKTTLGGTETGVVHDGSVDGTVGSVITPTFVDGYDYQIRIYDFYQGAASQALQIEGFLETSAAYNTAFSLTTGPSVSSEITATVTLIEPRVPRDVFMAECNWVYVDMNDSVANGGTSSAPIGRRNVGVGADVTEVLTRVRISFVSGNITNATNRTPIMKVYRRKNHT